MLGWLGTIVGAAAGGVAVFFTAPATLTVGFIATAACMVGGGGALGATAGKITSYFMDTHKSELEKQDKALAKDIQDAKTDGEKAIAAQKALDHQNTLLQTLSEKVKQNNTEMEEFRKIIKGEKELPEGKTLDDIKAEYAKREQENASLFEQIKKSQITSDLLQQIISKPGSFNMPALTFRNIGWGLGLVVISLIVIGIAVRAIKKWLGSLL